MKIKQIRIVCEGKPCFSCEKEEDFAGRTFEECYKKSRSQGWDLKNHLCPFHNKK